MSVTLVPSLVRYQRRSRYDVIATRESRSSGTPRNAPDSVAARTPMVSRSSSGATSTGSSVTSGFSSVQVGRLATPTPPEVRASMRERSWISASL